MGASSPRKVEFIQHLVLEFGIGVYEILPELPEKFPLSRLLGFQANADEGNDCFAHTYV
jgi:hypothetical protein